jgi:hypothetical protein
MDDKIGMKQYRFHFFHRCTVKVDSNIDIVLNRLRFLQRTVFFTINELAGAVLLIDQNVSWDKCQ